jgi:hypothetical protein
MSVCLACVYFGYTVFIMYSPISMDRGSISTPPPLPSRDRTATVSPRKPDYVPDAYDDDGYDTDSPEDESKFSIRGQLVAPRAEVARKFHLSIFEFVNESPDPDYPRASQCVQVSFVNLY